MTPKHKTGRPARTSALKADSAPTTNISVRLTADELVALDSHVARRIDEGATRSGLLREAAETAGLFTAVKKRGGS